nr:MAG TPA: hypothetical protein [Caudoviricetes sp.]
MLMCLIHHLCIRLWYFISAWALALPVQLQWAMREPRCVGQATRRFPRFFVL